MQILLMYQINLPLVVMELPVLRNTNDDVSSPQKDSVDVSSSPQKDRAGVSSYQPFNQNENRGLSEDQLLRVKNQSPRVNIELHSDSDSIYDVDEIFII